MAVERPEHVVRPLDEADCAADFRCREDALREYLRTRAWHGEVSGYSRTFVILPLAGITGQIWAFFTLVMSQIHTKHLPAEMQARLPKYPMPAALLAQMARDERLPSEWRVGQLAMGMALDRILGISRDIGCAAVTLDAKNDRLIDYDSRFGFVSLPKDRLRMFMTIEMLSRAG